MGATISVMLLAFGLSAPADDPYVLTDPNFLIPLNFDESKRASVREVLLYVSTDQGRTWLKVAEAKPDAKEFTYTARNEGLYFFAVQSVDKSGVADPPDVSKSPKFLKIQYDARRTTAPTPPAPPMPDVNAPPPPAFAPASPVVAPPAGVTQTNSLTPQPVGPIAPVAPPPMMPPPVVEQPAPAPVAQPPAIPQPTVNDGPGTLTPLAPQKPALEAAPKSLTPPPPAPAAEASTTRAPLMQHVRDRQVALDFEVERKGPSGIKKIETWITQDDGGTWQKWGPDTFETLSPVQVALPEAEGTYGFRIVLYSGVMQSAGPPRRGDEPDVKLHIDRTPPVVAYYAPVPDISHPSAITLRYSVSDLNLDASTIVLQWSRQPTVGWQTIPATNARPMPSSGIAGMNEASWHLTPDVPDTVYLRITAKDKAGNVGEFVTREPVTLDLNKPTARIKAVLPATARR